MTYVIMDLYAILTVIVYKKLLKSVPLNFIIFDSWLRNDFEMKIRTLLKY